MSIEAKCSECDRDYTLADDMVGKKVRCKGCGEVFTVAPALKKAPPPPIPKDIAVRSGTPTTPAGKRPSTPATPPRKRRDEDEEDRPRKRRDESYDEDEDEDRPRKRRIAEDDDEDDRPQRRKKKKSKAGSSSAMLWILGGAGVTVVLVGLIVVLAMVFMGSRDQVAKGPGPNVIAPVPNQPAPAQPQPVPAQPQPVPGQPQPAPVIPNPMQPPVAPPIPNNNLPQPPAPPGLYADLGNEEIAPADPGLPNTLLRARADDSIYRLSNPRVGQPKRFGPPGNALMVDYELVRKGKNAPGTLIIHGGDGRRSQVMLLAFGFQDRGTIEVTSFGGPFSQFPQHAEFYLIRSDPRYSPNMPTFKLSNSVTMGTMAITTKARNWTADEIARFTKAPPNYSSANAHPNVGKDTEFVGETSGGVKLRYVEPKGHLLGFDYRMGEWQKEKCFSGLTAVFAADQPETIITKRILAKPGYAVSGAEVHHERFVGGMKLHFQKLKADGSLDPADTYSSEVFGLATGKTKMLGNDGSKIVGINIQQGAVVNALALVKDGGKN